MAEIHQFLPGLTFGDAISDEAFEIQKTIRALGHRSEIYVWPEHLHPDLRKVAFPVQRYKPSKRHVLIYHHSIGTPLSYRIRDLPGRKIMIYHNVTPDHYVRPYSVKIADELRDGREELRMLKGAFELVLGDSEHNRLELQREGYRRTGVLPILMKLDKYRTTPDQKVLSLFNDDCPTIFFVGRVIPNKCPHDLLKAFNVYKKFINCRARLLIVGSYAGLDSYYRQLTRMIEELELKDIFITGHVSDSELVAYYKVGDLFLCLSEHEGFCVPIVECFLFEIPVIAYQAAAVPYTLGDAGILLHEKNYDEIVEAIDLVWTNEALRKELVMRGSRRFEAFFAPEVVRQKFLNYLQEFL
ncbi:MAG: glycosyltransferase family 4 protein [Acidobacteria bacterium]|nr:glycosyltransferase family 4 protein [Acidobacteriota bacterium]